VRGDRRTHRHKEPKEKQEMQSITKKADEKAGKVQPGESTRAADAPPTQPMKSESQEMKAVTWQGKKNIKVETDKPKPKLSDPRDAIIKVTACSICSGSDGHMYAGDLPGMDKGAILGHECMGMIESVGNDVKNFKQNDRVVVAFGVACGQCDFCKREE
jgi:hypothetical protein